MKSCKSEIKAGVRVRIKPGSRFSDQSEEIGTIVHSTPSRGDDGDMWYEVIFPNGDGNSYTKEDLDIIDTEWDV